MNKIKLTESELKNIIRESIKNVITELDWRTYQSDSEKDSDPRRSDRFRQAASNAFNRQNGYGLNNVPYGDGDDKDMTADGSFYGGTNLYHPYNDGGDSFDTFSGDADGNEVNAYYHAQRIGTMPDHTGRNDKLMKGNRGQALSPNTDKEMKTSFNPQLKMKQIQGDKQVRDYFNGKSKYKNGKWN